MLAPQYQQSLLAAIQRVAVFFGFETEPTWATLRQELMAQINLQRLFGSLLASLGSILVTFVVVLPVCHLPAGGAPRLRDQAGQPVGRPAARGAHPRGHRDHQPAHRLVPGAEDAAQHPAGRGQLGRDGAVRAGVRGAVGGADRLPELRALHRLGAGRGVPGADDDRAVRGPGHDPVDAAGAERGAVRHRQLPRPLRDGQLAEPEPLRHPDQPGGVVRAVGHPGRLSRGADHRHHDHRVLRVPGHAAGGGAAVARAASSEHAQALSPRWWRCSRPRR